MSNAFLKSRMAIFFIEAFLGCDYDELRLAGMATKKSVLILSEDVECFKVVEHVFFK